MSVARVAERAGVSAATVSRVLNNSRPVSPAIAEAVHRAMQELNVPVRSNRRRQLSGGEGRYATFAILTIGQSYQGWFQMPVVAGVVAELSRAAQAERNGVLITEMPDPSRLSPVLRRREAQGALAFVDNWIEGKDLALLRQHMPVVRVLGGQFDAQEIDHVCPDHHAIGYMAGRYLLDQGLRELAFLSLRPTWDLIQLRAQGFMAAALNAGLRPRLYYLGGGTWPREPIFASEAIAEDDLPRLIGRLAAMRKGKLGLFVPRDEETAEVYGALRQAGLEPDRDVTIVSCDNEAVRLSMLHPRPASIDLNAREIARHAVGRLLALLADPDQPPVRIMVKPSLVPGELLGV